MFRSVNHQGIGTPWRRARLVMTGMSNPRPFHVMTVGRFVSSHCAKSASMSPSPLCSPTTPSRLGT
ncbi:MAG: hypothetical protein ABSE49_30035 [Polyangiaceae bacterium]